MKQAQPNSPKPFNLVEAHKHEMNKPEPIEGEKGGSDDPLDDKALTEI